MPLYRDEAVVLRTHKLGEADRIVTMLSRSRGQIRGVAKGIRRTSSKFGSRLEPFMLVDVQLYEGKNLDTISQVETLASYGKEIIDDYPSYTAATAIVETAEKITGTEAATQQFILVVGALRAIAQREHDVRLILDSYLLRALALAGWAPNFDSCTGCGKPGPHRAFQLQVGGVVCDSCKPAGAVVLDTETSLLLGSLLAGDWDYADQSSDKARASASGVVSAYTQWHLERGLKSLQHVERE